MFDAAPAYEKYVVELDDIDDAPEREERDATSAAADEEEEVVMQVLVLGQWHRCTPDHASTACGVPFRFVNSLKRREVLTQRAHLDAPPGDMCPDCFTQFEIAQANARDEAARKAEDAALQQWTDEAPQRAAELEARTARAIERRHLLTTPRGMVPLKKPEGDR